MKGGKKTMNFENKKGLSTIVTTLIIILLSLVAIGIIWVVVSNVIEGGAEQSEINAKCLQIDIKATAAGCDGGDCNVTYRRSSGGDDIDGIKVVLSNGQESFTHSVSVNVQPLSTNTTTTIATGLAGNISSVQIAAYFIDASGNEQICATTSTFEF